MKGARGEVVVLVLGGGEAGEGVERVVGVAGSGKNISKDRE